MLTGCQVHQENLSLLGEQSELSQEVATMVDAQPSFVVYIHRQRKPQPQWKS